MVVDYFFSVLFISAAVATILARHPLASLFFSFLMGLCQTLIFLRLGMVEMAAVILFYFIATTVFLYAFVLLLYKEKSVFSSARNDKYLVAGGIWIVLLLLGIMTMCIDENYEFLTGTGGVDNKLGRQFPEFFKYFLNEYSVPLQVFPLFMLSIFFSATLLLRKGEKGPSS